MLNPGREGAANDQPPEAEAWPDPPLTPPVQLMKGAEQMLTGEQVLSMIEAGFTAEEIRAYNQPEETPADPEPAPEPEAPAEPEEAPADPENVSREEFKALQDSIAQLTKTIQTNNILHASQKTPDKLLTPEEAADAAIRAFFGSDKK